MGNREVFEAFAASFVRPEFRYRFAHEAAKKPEKLLARVCHTSDDLFDRVFLNGNCSYASSEGCLVLASSFIRGFRASTWAEVQREIGLGEGILVIGIDGDKFYAETEASKGAPSVVFAGGS